MNQIDRLVLGRLASRIGVTVFIFYGLIALVESLDTWRFSVVESERGFLMALLMVAMSAVRWTIKTLPVTVLMGAILGLVDLKMRHELTVIKASGISIWRVLRAPTLVLAAASLVIAIGAETVSTQINRDLYPIPPGQTAQLTPAGEIWLEQYGEDSHYVLMARAMSPGGEQLTDVTVFNLQEADYARYEAPTAVLQQGYWVLSDAIGRRADAVAKTLPSVRLSTISTPSEISLKTSSTDDLTFFELATLMQKGIADPMVASATAMRLIKLLALPLVLVGSLFIAFAFTAGYSRRMQIGPSVLYGMVLGFLVFVITEMADRAGSTGAIDPLIAAISPALVAIIIGVTVLLRREDGWT
ncbi:LptF/LptG family permease [Devosia sp. WQ 349]|uniref:LptF/LptG family permease n=1 Tax=Devosia sp. WQ 349K1 TaxID=2800329 RepID=UPI0019034E6F|nr:LptF/LptG family permease [Devosia sp. WQ 349K1]MBK1794123.1 LptF/LptG family permease [Devosia sp. WQ 349K1]